MQWRLFSLWAKFWTVQVVCLRCGVFSVATIAAAWYTEQKQYAHYHKKCKFYCCLWRPPLAMMVRSCGWCCPATWRSPIEPERTATGFDWFMRLIVSSKNLLSLFAMYSCAMVCLLWLCFVYVYPKVYKYLTIFQISATTSKWGRFPVSLAFSAVNGGSANQNNKILGLL